MAAVARKLLNGIATRDYERIAGCFADDAVLSALTPSRLRRERGPAEVAARYEHWFGNLDSFELLSSEAEEVADTTRVRYLIRGRHPERGWQVNEHTAYLHLDGDRIAVMRLTCSGFRVAGPPA